MCIRDRKKHRATAEGDDAELESELIDEIDTLDEAPEQVPASDPRWDALKKLTSDEQE